MKLRNALILVTALALLIGCDKDLFNLGVQIPLEEYDAEFQTQAAEEYTRLSDNSKVKTLVDDYGDLRAVVRCFNDKKECEGPQ